MFVAMVLRIQPVSERIVQKFVFIEKFRKSKYFIYGEKLFTTAQKSVATSAIENNFIFNRFFETIKQILFSLLTCCKGFIYSICFIFWWILYLLLSKLRFYYSRIWSNLMFIWLISTLQLLIKRIYRNYFSVFTIFFREIYIKKSIWKRSILKSYFVEPFPKRKIIAFHVYFKMVLGSFLVLW